MSVYYGPGIVLCPHRAGKHMKGKYVDFQEDTDG